METKAKRSPIGILDSGIGGLSIYKHVRELMEQEDVVYIADKKYFPYGKLSESALEERMAAIAEWLLSKGCKLVIVACNTASVSTLSFLRRKFPETLFVGTVPPIKPCAETTKNKKIGIMCTPGTAKSEYQKDLIKKFAPDCEVLIKSCPGLVEAIENNDNASVQKYISEYLSLLKKYNIDTLGLGCTHFPLAEKNIQDFMGENVKLIDPGSAVARQALRLLTEKNALNTEHGSPGKTHFYTTDNPELFDIMIDKYAQDKVNSIFIEI